MDHCHCYPSFHTYYIQLKCTVCNFFLIPEISLSHGHCNDSWYFSMLHVLLSLPVSCLSSPFFVGITTLLIQVVSYLKHLVSWFLHLYYGSIFHRYGICYAKYCKFQQCRSVFLEFNFLNWHKHLEKHCFSRSRVNFILNYANMLVNWHKNYSHLPCHQWSISIFFPLTPSLTHILPPHTLPNVCQLYWHGQRYPWSVTRKKIWKSIFYYREKSICTGRPSDMMKLQLCLKLSPFFKMTNEQLKIPKISWTQCWNERWTKKL